MKNIEHGGYAAAETEKDREIEERIGRCLKGLRGFVSESVPFPEAEKIPDEGLFPFLAEYFNRPGSRDHYLEMKGLTANESGEGAAEFDSDEYAEYLLSKLPLSLRDVWADRLDDSDDESARQKAVAGLEKAVSGTDRGMVLGFHTSPFDFGNPESGRVSVTTSETNDTFVNQGGAENNAAKSWYVIDPKSLYRGAQMPGFIYLVEGSRGDIGSGRHYDERYGAIYSHGNIPVRAKIPLFDETSGENMTEEVCRRLGCGFSEMGTI